MDVNGTVRKLYKILILNLILKDIADAFIMCGVIYGLESDTERDTFISYAYDLYRNESMVHMKIKFNLKKVLFTINCYPFKN